MKILHCSLALGLLLSACATQYSPPAGSATTTIALVAPAEEMFGLGQSFSVVSGEDCTNGSILAGFNPMSSERSTNRLLPIGTRQFIRVGLSNSRTFPLVRSCINLVSFVPTEGTKYRMRHRFEGESCSVELLQDDGKAPATLQTHNARACR
jgi:hypothetical protein